MKISFTKALLSIASVMALLSTPAVNAKLNGSSENIALEAQIKQNINEMLGYAESPVSKTDIAKEIKNTAIELQTNELVRSTDEKLPKFKFKVVIAD